MEVFFIALVSYLLGSIPFGFLLTKIFLKKDIREIGSGNIGATNVLRTGNKIIGYITFAGMIYQGILGGKMYNGDYSVYNTHKTLGKIVSVSYFTGAGLSLFTPPPLVSREREGLNNIKLHKIFANIHVPAMIITNVYADKQHDADKYREIHKVSAYTAFASYSFAMISIILDF